MGPISLPKLCHFTKRQGQCLTDILCYLPNHRTLYETNINAGQVTNLFIIFSQPIWTEVEPPGDDKQCEHAYFQIQYLHNDLQSIWKENLFSTSSAFGGVFGSVKGQRGHLKFIKFPPHSAQRQAVKVGYRSLYHRIMHRIVTQYTQVINGQPFPAMRYDTSMIREKWLTFNPYFSVECEK